MTGAILPLRNWNQTLLQMQGLPNHKTGRPSGLLTLLAWQSNIYWLWNERNSRLHTNSFRSIDSLFSSIDRQIRNMIQGFRTSNPRLSSSMSQLWFTHAWSMVSSSSPSHPPSLSQLCSFLLISFMGLG